MSNYAHHLPQFITDAHPSVQEKALELLAVYVAKCPQHVFPMEESLVRGLVEKGVASAKSTIRL